VRLAKVLPLLLVAACAVAAWLLLAPFGPHTETFVEIPSGTGAEGIARRLAAAGVISNPYVFEAMRVYEGGTLRAGEYRFDHAVPMSEVYRRIERGDVFTVELVIPEGFNVFDIAQAIQSAGLGSKDAFLAAERGNTALIADLSPHARSLEGYLFPDTYRFSRHASPEQMLAVMVKRFRQVTGPLGASSERTVTLASLVEKEVRLDTERPLVAGVFENRLAQGMTLATDPSVIYAALLAGRWRGTIYQSDLQFDSPYNTYRHAGLPPGPICNPGVAALKAAIHPAKTEYLYFVADAAGHSRFSTGLKEHNAQVQAYRDATRR
jgi:UPF0755 protein